MNQRIVRSLVFSVDPVAPGLRWLLAEFRLIVNRSIRIALREDIRSRGYVVDTPQGRVVYPGDVRRHGSAADRMAQRRGDGPPGAHGVRGPDGPRAADPAGPVLRVGREPTYSRSARSTS